ncbi:hypothetical protein [Flagellimonas zhangzhouensis]|uniref:Viral A-type inclusion protein n=1 Tax=Flagellimonas zhangzhouensis TaxID=1073328 RepID=A0A1H2VBN1_9FLAO|nr:hypothetical protein [Allomuricauda zhangzhouensis]SDQ09104.1 hypothetical protein SAMN05216294_0285 [Allomuricauda zhangzhouensis]SDW65771.1 hypothetical protein SAMN04487892_2008 [Allomuricauda zhangzhouensis]
MRKFISLLFISSLLIGFSCKEDPKKENEGVAQMKKIIAIHDEVMPKMSTIGKLVGKLKPMVDTTEVGQKYDVAMKDLQDAHKSMMDWMKDFGTTFDYGQTMKGEPLTPEQLELLDVEEEKVNVVADKINGSIERAESLLAEAKVE